MNIDVEGIFHAGGRFDNPVGYEYQLTASKVANPAVLAKGMKPHEEELDERKFACGGERPR